MVKAGKTYQFGLITSNSIKQAYVRRAVEPHLAGPDRLSIVFAVPDHPWVDATDGAAVRISMTVARQGTALGILRSVTQERTSSFDSEDLVLGMSDRTGSIGADLRVGPDMTRANLNLCSVGMKTIGDAFQVDEATARKLGRGSMAGLDNHIRPYLNARDFTGRPRGKFVIDFFGLHEAEVRSRYPDAYQHLLVHAKPGRLVNRNHVFQRTWWIIGHPRPQFRSPTAGLGRYIVTPETSKHRVYGFLSVQTVPDSALVTLRSTTPSTWAC